MSKKHLKQEQEEMEIKKVNPEVEEAKEEAKVDLEAELLQWKDKYLRMMAEFENFRKRSIAEKSDWIRLATQKFALEICDVADNFERALAQGSDEELDTPFGKGVLMIEKQLLAALDKEGVKKMEVQGKPFDPEFHDALAHIPSDLEENAIAAVIQNGYMMNDKVLRPARVAVSNGANYKDENKTSLEE